MEQGNKICKRSEVKIENTWALEDMFADDAAWEKAASALAGKTEKVGTFAGHLGDDAQTLYSWLTFSDELNVEAGKMGGYAFRRADEDLGDNAHQAMKGRAISILVALQSAASFADPELMQLDDAVLEGFYQAEPKLQTYRRALSEIRRRRAHVLSSVEEKLLADVGEMAETPSNVSGIFRNADLKFPDVVDSEGQSHTLTQGTYIPYMESADRTLRKSAFETLYHTFASHENLTAALIDAQLKQQTFFARARKYSTNLEASLDVTNVPTAVYFNLIETVHQHLTAMYRYMQLRKKLMGVDELHMYDLYNTIVEDAEVTIPFEQAKAATLEAVSPLGDEYGAVVRRAFAERWIDVYENEGKRGGAYSSGDANPHPYILLNHKDTLNSQFTLAHEMGHAMHSYLSHKNQPTADSEYVIFVAEVASTCNEVLMMQSLLKKTNDRKQRAYLINYFLEQFRTTLYRQTMFAEFELKINERAQAGESLTAETLNSIYYELNKLYYGTDMVVDAEIASEWARIPHFYYNYYVFQYATGFSAAIALAMKILQEGEPAVKNYLKFLSSGCSTDPISLLKIAGVDMATPAPVDAALKMFDELISELQQLTD